MEVDDYMQNILIDLDSKDSNIVLQRITEVVEPTFLFPSAKMSVE